MACPWGWAGWTLAGVAVSLIFTAGLVIGGLLRRLDQTPWEEDL